MRHLDVEAVERLLPWPAAISAARRTAEAAAAGTVYQADRIWHSPTGMPGQIGVMPSYLPDDGLDPAIFVTKLVGVFPDATPSVNGVLVALDGTTGASLAMIDATAVTARRTAAASALSVDLLARDDAATLAIVGAGAQGRAHLEAVMAVRDITSVRVWNRGEGRAEALAQRTRELPGIDRVAVKSTPAEAAADADIVCVCTNSPTALLGSADIAPGTHVTAIGAFTPDTRELAADLIAAATVVVDDRTAASHEAGDILMAITEGVVPPDVVRADLADLTTGRVVVRPSDQDITVYKSVGTSAMDAVAVRGILAADADQRLAVYGTLAPGQPNDDVLTPFGGDWRPGRVTGRRLSDGWQGYPGLRLDDHGTVEVHVLDHATINWGELDRFEGPGYRRRRVVVAVTGGPAAMTNIYVLA